MTKVLTLSCHRLSTMGILVATLGLAAPVENPSKPLTAYFESANVLLAADDSGSRQLASLGPWVFGPRLEQGKPLDKRLNLYVVVPGKQYRSPTSPEYDHTLIVNGLTHDNPREWDIFWCLVLDPKLREDFQSEKDLIVAAHETFKPADLFDLEDVPARSVLTEEFGARTLADLRRYRHKDGSMPRLLILPARFAIRATVEMPESGSSK
ncbi:MAG TPA: hypothetical protein VG649_09665 [Candidatus Angelobacter sp.]|jgi:hypothetical protein|nr:hypothetical protein [Candidatus Angelobacter sp.]